MIPYILAAVGGYLIGDSLKGKQFAEGGMMDEAPTYMMTNEKVRQEIGDIITRLKELDVDGETMQYILEEVGMSDQMLRQLVMTAKKERVEELIEQMV